MTQFVSFRASMTRFKPKTTKTTTAARGYAQVAAARAGQPTSIMSVWRPKFATIAWTLGPTWARKVLMTRFTPQKPTPVVMQHFRSVPIFTRRQIPMINMIIGIMHMGPRPEIQFSASITTCI